MMARVLAVLAWWVLSAAVVVLCIFGALLCAEDGRVCSSWLLLLCAVGFAAGVVPVSNLIMEDSHV